MKSEAILINRPGSERRINLAPYFRDVKDDTTMEETASYSSPSCGEIEYVLSGNQFAVDDTEPNTTSMYDFVEIIDSELVVYCDWYTQETGSFEVSVAARLKWFASEMSTPVTFQIMLN